MVVVATLFAIGAVITSALLLAVTFGRNMTRLVIAVLVVTMAVWLRAILLATRQGYRYNNMDNSSVVFSQSLVVLDGRWEMLWRIRKKKRWFSINSSVAL